MDIIITQDLKQITMMELTIPETRKVPDGIRNNLVPDGGNI
jgi:hypothetical protein